MAGSDSIVEGNMSIRNIALSQRLSSYEEAHCNAFCRPYQPCRDQHGREQESEMELWASNSPSTSFSSRRINSTTFLIIEDDIFGEHPHIYVKVYPEILLISDTGCNEPRRDDLSVTYLRQYLEEYPSPSNNNQPLNPQGRKEYILGIEQFEGPNTTIIASNHSKSFILEDLPTHSLCKYLKIPTPLYEVTYWARNLEYLNYKHKPTNTDIPLRIQTFHVPGHTPDSLAWYDIDEHHLYVGDTFYAQYRSEPFVPGLRGEKSAIIFPNEGNLIDYRASLSLLFEFVTRQNEILRHQHTQGAEAPRVLVSCGHSTFAEDAESMISEVLSFFMRILGYAIPVVWSAVRRGELFDAFEDPDDDGYSVLAPRRLIDEARERIG